MAAQLTFICVPVVPFLMNFCLVRSMSDMPALVALVHACVRVDGMRAQMARRAVAQPAYVACIGAAAHIMLHLMIVIRPYIDEAFITLLAFVRRQCIVHRFGLSEEVGPLLVLGK